MVQDTSTKKKEAGTGEIPLSAIFFRVLHCWPWVLLSFAVCMGAALLYLLCTPKLYTETASLLIKDENQGKSAGVSASDFSDLGLFASNTNVQNEMETIKSPDLMEEVVNTLDLTTNYYLPGVFHNTIAYGSSLPLTVSMPQLPDNYKATFHLAVSEDGTVTISDMVVTDNHKNETESPRDYTAKLNSPVPTVAGPLTVTPSAVYKPGEEYKLIVNHIPLSVAVKRYCHKLKVSIDNELSTVINLSVTDENTERADAVLYALISAYNQNWIDDKNQVAVSTSKFIDDRLQVIESELGNVDSDISSYKSSNLVPDVNLAASKYLDENQKLSEQILDYTNQLQILYRIKATLSNTSGEPRPLPANTGLNDAGIQKQISDYNDRVLQRNRLVSKSSDRNPLVTTMDDDILGLGMAIAGSVDNSIQSYETQIRGLQSARGNNTSKIASNPTQAKYLLSVERQQKVKENLYLFLLQKREDNELNQAFTAYSSRVIQRPGGTGKPTSPRTGLILGFAFVIGLAIPFAVIYIRETYNTKIRGRKDVAEVGIPLLGEIPAARDASKKKKNDPELHEVIVKPGQRDVVNEAFRVLRTNVEFARINKQGCNVMAITSFNPGSGKSFIATNLATAFAIKNKKVLLIDADLRRGSTSAFVGNPSKGLSDFLDSQVTDVKSLLVTSPESPNLQVLPIGKIPPNPTELIESPVFGEMIEKMRPDYDFIFIDCPPIEVVADTKIIDQYTDRTIFIIRAGLFERAMLPEIDRLNEEKQYNRMAFILNATASGGGRYGNSYGYGYGYGNGYGNGYGYGTKAK